MSSSRSCTWQNRYDKLSFPFAHYCIKQGNLYECISKSLRLLNMVFIYKHESLHLAMRILINIKEAFLANMLMMNKHLGQIETESQ